MKRFQDKKQEQEQLKKDNKGFSLVELIIVIAIMAILVGIVGTQVIPYLNRSREAKDVQILNSFSTAAVTVYSQNAEMFADAEAAGTVTIDIADGSVTPSLGDAGGSTAAEKAQKVIEQMKDLTGYTDIGKVKDAMSSKDAKQLTNIKIYINFSDTPQNVGEGGEREGRTLTAVAYGEGGAEILEPVVSHI